LTALRTVYVELALKVTGYKAGIVEARVATQGLASEIDKAARAGKLDHLADRARNLGLVMAGAFAAIEFAAARFEQQMSKVAAVADTTAENMLKLRDAALAAGRSSNYTATQAAEAEEELAKAGISVADILGGGLKGALSLAAAGDLDLAESATIAARAMNQFGLHGGDVSHIADLLAASANKSASDVHGLGMSLRMSGLAAAAAGMSLEETVGTLSAFADRGLIASDAGTSLKQMLLQLQAPSDKAAGLMRQLGINAYDSQGAFIGTTKLAGMLQKALGGLTQEQRNSALAIIFGADAMRAANVLYTVGEQGIRDYTQAVDDQGAAARAAATKMDNLIGDVKHLKGSLESLAIDSSSGANKGLRDLTQGANALVNQFARLPAGVSSTIVVMTGLGAAALLTTSAMIKLRTSTNRAFEELAAAGPRSAKLAGGLQQVTVWGGRAAAAFVALQVVGAIGTMMSSTAADSDRLAKSLEGLSASAGKANGELERVFGSDLERLRSNLNFFKQGVGNAETAAQIESIFGVGGFKFSTSRRLEEMKALDAALAQLVSSGHAADAAAWFQRISAEAAKQGINVQTLAEIFPAYTQAAKDAAKATTGVAAAHELARMQGAMLEAGLAGLVQEAGSLANAFAALHGAEMSWAHAEIEAEEALDNLDKALKDNGKTLDVHTEKGRANKLALLGSIDASVNAAQKKYDEEVATKGATQALQDANKVYQDYIEQIRKKLIADGYSAQQAKEILDLYSAMPPLITTNLKLEGGEKAKSTLQGLLELAKKIPAGLTNYGSSASGYRGYRWGGITPMHAREGLLSQARVFPGTGPFYAFAEPGTGQEAFVPRNGDRDRSLGTLATAAGWYGHALAPAGPAGAPTINMGGATVVVTPTVRPRAGAAAALADMVEVTVDARLEGVSSQIRGGPR